MLIATGMECGRIIMLKWLVGILTALLLVAAVYIGSAVISLADIVSAVRTGDGSSVLQRTDIPRVRHALIDQILDAYLDRQRERRKLSPFQRMAVNAFGASIADGVVAKIITPANLSALLRTGAVQNVSDIQSISGIPALGNLDVDRTLALLSRFEFIKPVEFSIRLGNLEDDARVSIHFDNWSWKLSGVQLPNRLVREIASRLPSL
jgi:hypothetical protein